MDFATLIGFTAAVAVLVMAVLKGGDVSVIVNTPSLLIVLGGTMGVIMMKFSIGQFFGAVKVAMKTLLNKSTAPTDLIEQVMTLAQEARKGGVLALESVEISHPFLKQGIQYIVDGLDPEIIEETLTKEMTFAVERHHTGRLIFKSMGDVAPAMGMIGTLIGLVQMLSNMNDPSSIGPAMAVAMLTTLYGAMLANLFALPIADKLELRRKEEKFIKSMIIDAVMCIQEGRNPRIMRDILKMYLPGSKRADEEKAESDASAAA